MQLYKLNMLKNVNNDTNKIPWRRRKKLKAQMYIMFHSDFLLADYILFILVLFLLIGNSSMSEAGGMFPLVEDLSIFKPVKVTSSCGLNNKTMTYCKSDKNISSLNTCDRSECRFGCCKNCGAYKPSFINIDKDGKIIGNVFVSNDVRPKTRFDSEGSKNFLSGYIFYKPLVGTSNFTFSGWFKQTFGNNGVLIQRWNDFKIYLHEYNIILNYATKGLPLVKSTNISFSNVLIKQNGWSHLAMVVSLREVSLFLDGDLIRTAVLDGILSDLGKNITIGRMYSGGGQYFGLMQDVKYFSKGLTNREIIEAMNGSLPFVPYPNCRCPETHPKLSPKNSFYCMKNGLYSGDLDLVNRLSLTSFPPEYMVDGVMSSYWLSEQKETVKIDFSLKYSNLQITLISISFYSPMPKGIKIERSLDFGKKYQPWQYFSTDCKTIYGIENDGPLPNPDSVNCLHVPNPQASWESIQFSPHQSGSAQQPQRPYEGNGCNDFYCSQTSLDFVKATDVRITFQGHSLATDSLHQYFGVRRVIIGGRCDCYGHAKTCTFEPYDNPNPKYVCNCDPSTHTIGDQCQLCHPLYRDKLFARGTVTKLNPCKKCECNDHADSCFYNVMLDPDPKDRSIKGGGVCENCKHFTMGRHCDTCQDRYYRPSGKALNSPDVCQSCQCNGPGVIVQGSACQKDDSDPKKIAGQCNCKLYVSGRQCDSCKTGYYKLESSNQNGCSECNCNTVGTVRGSVACDINSGQCTCKTNVIGVKCTNCKARFYGLSAANPEGCSPCACNPIGSNLETFCDVTSGQCSCKARFEGRACDRCQKGYFGPTCKICTCSSKGTKAGSLTNCDPNTGQCACKEHVTGIACDQCKESFFGLSTDNPIGCSQCKCLAKGTIGNTGICSLNGTCTCKSLVTGTNCDRCKDGSYGLSATNPDGCTKCQCFPQGTVGGDSTPRDQLICSDIGQCSCMPNVEGNRCDKCIPLSYWKPDGLGCIPCSCNVFGSKSLQCNSTGYCPCKEGTGVGGRMCDQCLPGYYKFKDGRCTPCDCFPAGTLGPNCDANGKCTQCKRNVVGEKCELCKTGTAKLETINPFGCSGAPSEQGPPEALNISSRSVTLVWDSPDNPNGVVTRYNLYRNGTLIYGNIMRSYVDMNLLPFTNYVYHVFVFTSGGSSKSVDNLFVKTLSDKPEGIEPPVITQIRDRSVVATWKPPTSPNGIITQYVLLSVSKDGHYQEHFKGIGFNHQVTGLNPFTMYTFQVSVCTLAGCNQSMNVSISTRSAAPDSQPAPYTKPLTGGRDVLVRWDPPAKPNGEIRFYDLYFRDSPFIGEGNTAVSNLNPTTRNFTVTSLQPYTVYEFRVVCFTAQVKGSTASNWTRIRTLEGVPTGGLEIKPTSTPLSSVSIKLSWKKPAHPNGVITRHEVYMYTKETEFKTASLVTSVSGILFTHTVTGLLPYTRYQFSIKTCNSIGCTQHSYKTSATTLETVPVGQGAPSGEFNSSNAIMLTWKAPVSLNGPESTIGYIVERRLPSFNYPPPHVMRGVHFPSFGFYKFNPNLMPDSATTVIDFHFKTRFLGGLIFFAASEQQEDMVAVELRDGLPWFIFDTESGAVAFTVQSNVKFNDNHWHHVLVTRHKRDGKIIVDGKYSRMESIVGDKSIIGQIKSVFIGGLPKNFKITRKDDGKATLKQMHFIGCLRDFKLKGTPVNFKSAIEKSPQSPIHDHCPASFVDGIFFKGGGYILLKENVFKAGPTFTIKFRLKTSGTRALVFLSRTGATFLAVYIMDRKLTLQYKTGKGSGIQAGSSQSLCDGIWHDIILRCSAYEIMVYIDERVDSRLKLPDDLSTSLTYLGGIPPGVGNSGDINTHESLHGCLQNLVIGTTVYFPHVVEAYHNIGFDGCPAKSSSSCSSVPTDFVYNGTELHLLDHGLKTYTNYLYRVKSYHRHITGFSVSSWLSVRSGEGDPEKMITPTVVEMTARKANLSWEKPGISGGLVLKYVIHAIPYPLDINQSQVTFGSGLFNGVISDLTPATQYRFQVEAFTSMGSAKSPSINGSTLNAAPEGFQLPTVDSYPNALNVSWLPPAHANGRKFFYEVTLDDIRKYNGNGLNVYIKGLSVYTTYTLKVAVCNIIDCVENTLKVVTGQLPPSSVVAPQLRVLGSRRIQVLWTPPKERNGKITKYEVYTSNTTSQEDMFLSFTGSPTTSSAVIKDLIPGTLYFIRVKAYTEAGGTIGDASEAQTLESAPEEIPLPRVYATSSSSFFVTIYPPLKPNGVITSYVLLQNERGSYKTAKAPFNFTISGLEPYSKHIFKLRACTAQGCGLSDPLSAYTGHAQPIGNITLSARVINSRSFDAKWNAISQPNGLIVYQLQVYGEFYLQPGVNFVTANMTQTCYSGNITEQTVVCDKVLPFTSYHVTINGSNDAGHVLSNTVNISTPSDVPVGIHPLSYTPLTPEKIHLSWKPPGRMNGILKSYTLYGKFPVEDNFVMKYEERKIHSGLFTKYNISGLKPFTNYSFCLEVTNDVGTTRGQINTITTMEDVPSAVDAPKISYYGARWIQVEISPPADPNGIIIAYQVFINGSLYNTTTKTSVDVRRLRPFSTYDLHIGACTKVGCVNSSSVLFDTLQDAPEDAAPPFLFSNSSRTVFISWKPPNITNGIILAYEIQRKLNHSSALQVVVRLGAYPPYNYIDQAVVPHTSYLYRISAETKAGRCFSPYGAIKTPEGEPEGLEAPTIVSVSTSSLLIRWKPPRIPNGNLIKYILYVGSRNITIQNVRRLTFNVTNLLSYIEYPVIVSACTNGGCGNSTATKVRTLKSFPSGQQPPSAEALTNSSLRVRWKEPLHPNGPIKFYILMGRVVESLVSEDIDSPSEWRRLAQTVGTMFDHKALGIYSLHQYMVQCVTTEGNTTSNASTLFRTKPGRPIAGPFVSTHVTNHTSILVTWKDPPLKQLKGIAVEYSVAYEVVSSGSYYEYGKYPASVTSVAVSMLRPETIYAFTVTLFNGAGSKQSEQVKAQTRSGTPEGFEKPTVYQIRSHDIRIVWKAPRVPNGRITNYTIVANDMKMDTVDGNTLFHQQRNLRPYFDYVIKVQVCTRFSCILSDGTPVKTYSAPPTNMLGPSVIANSSHDILISWKPPLFENGIMTGYQLFRQSIYTCPAVPPPQKKCTYISCKLNEQLCGTTCYDPRVQTCCGSKHYPIDGRMTCCEDNYVMKNSPNDVCCGGEFFPFQPSYQCCFGYYRQVPHGHVCCPSQSSIVVGIGDSCCGDVPYFLNGTKSCLCGGLYNKYPNIRQCCGGKVVSLTEKCCGNDTVGQAYTPDDSKMCCGTGYVSSQNALCCNDSLGNYKVQKKIDPTSQIEHKCCGTNSIRTTEACCNSVGYDNTTHVCSDRSSNGITGCGDGTVCPLRSKQNAVCNECSFDSSKSICFHIAGYYGNMTKKENETCSSEYKEILKNPDDPTILSFKDIDLSPHTEYDYYVMGFNTEGNVTSPTNGTMTLMAGPEGMSPPVPTVLSATTIMISWKKPTKPNGKITKYILYRIKWTVKNEVLVFEGNKLSFVDKFGLVPYTGYMYKLSACTNYCSNISASALVYTLQDRPADVIPPILTPLSPYSMRVNWSLPKNPNGKITRYNISMMVKGGYSSILPEGSLGESMHHIVSGLEPYTLYSFKLEACTIIGCTVSIPKLQRTLQAAPEGVRDPEFIILGPRKVEAQWEEPILLNGIIQYYLILRNGSVVYNNTFKRFVDETVQPAMHYEYALRAFTLGGFAESKKIIVYTPESSPDEIAAPILKSLNSTAIHATWTAPNKPNGQIVSYSVLYQVFSGPPQKKFVGFAFKTTITNLYPFSLYDVRIEACTNRGCGVGKKQDIRTDEAPPRDQQPPVLAAKSNNIIVLSWKPPGKPNGIITKYKVQRRELNIMVPVIAYQGLRREYYDTNVKPYTTYQYNVISYNNVGYAESTWKTILSLEDIPADIQPPKVNVTSSTTVIVSWAPPLRPNGRLKYYAIHARKLFDVGNETVVKSDISVYEFSAQLTGFLPSIKYQFRIVAVNSAGSGVSGWTIAEMDEALPGSVPKLMSTTVYENQGGGLSLAIFWDKPLITNGAITNYILYHNTEKIHEGMSRKAMLTRVAPYTNYTFYLSVCNLAGCTRGEKEILTSGELKPAGQIPPKVLEKSSTSVKISWSPPLNPNGKVLMYQVIMEETLKTRKRRTETIVYSTEDTSKTVYSYTHTSLKPYRNYRFKVRVVNAKGSIDSDWISVTTEEGRPEGLTKLTFETLPGPQILVKWEVPSEPNGVIIYYDVYRNDLRIDGVTQTRYLDTSTELRPVTTYKYKVSACTRVGCTMSESFKVTTLSGAPADMLPPTLQALDAHRVKVTWQPPKKPNGKIIRYIVYIGKHPVFSGDTLETIKGDLVPYTDYSFSVSACTSQNCTLSKSASVRTKEGVPRYLKAPELRVRGSRIIEVQWKPPEEPNGFIKYYILKRGGEKIFNGTSRFYIDQGVLPGRPYNYTVTAVNSAGSVTSRDVTSQPTAPGLPEQVFAPSLKPESSSSILVTWEPPGLPNGKIVAYYVIKGENEFVANLESRIKRVGGLKSFTQYEFRIKACTVAGCASSGTSKATTLEAAPKGQDPPYFPSDDIKQNSIKAVWSQPKEPNGVIVSYRLDRQNLPDLKVVQVYIGPATSFTDSGISSGAQYNYRVTSTNSAGSTSSTFSQVTTKSAAPSGVKMIDIKEIKSTQFTFSVPSPDNSNGKISETIVELVGVKNVSGVVPYVLDLVPFTNYKVRLYMCNNAGCGRGPIKEVKTKADLPGALRSPEVVSKTANGAVLKWRQPDRPNGILSGYVVAVSLSCEQNVITCVEYDKKLNTVNTSLQLNDLKPFSDYLVNVTVSNQVGSVVSPNLQFKTNGASPIFIAPVNVSFVTRNHLLIDWSQTFELRGKLVEYNLLENGRIIYTGNRVQNERVDLVDGFYQYEVRVTTDKGTTKSGVVSQTIGTGLFPGARSADPWYKTVWFFALCALAIILLLFVIIVFGCMGYRKKRTVYVRQREPLPIKNKYGPRTPTPMDVRSVQYASSVGGGSNPSKSRYVVRGSEYEHDRATINSMDQFDETRSQRRPESVTYQGVPTVRYQQDRSTPSRFHTNHNAIQETAITGKYREEAPDDHYVTRDFDSGMSDDSPVHADQLDTVISNAYTSVQQERILFPDTHL